MAQKSDPILQFDSLVPKSPLLEGQLSVLVGIKGPGNDGATFFCNCHLNWKLEFEHNYCTFLWVYLTWKLPWRSHPDTHPRKHRYSTPFVQDLQRWSVLFNSNFTSFYLVEFIELLEVEQFVFCSILVVQFRLHNVHICITWRWVCSLLH